jgi:transposase
MGKPGPRKIGRYTQQFKATAVRLSELPDVLVRDVADALDIHPFMLSRWRRSARQGMLMTKGAKLDVETAAELKRLRQIEKEHAILKEEHALLKKAIRFASSRKRKSSPSSKQTGLRMRWR